MTSLTISIGADHGGYELKNALMDYLRDTRPTISLINRGTDTADSVSYPDFARTVVHDILEGSANLGILVCGTGIGMSIQANRFKGIRAALVTTPYMAEMTKAHNNANILCLGGRTTTIETAKEILEKWLDTSFEGGRHGTRIAQFDQ